MRSVRVKSEVNKGIRIGCGLLEKVSRSQHFHTERRYAEIEKYIETILVL